MPASDLPFPQRGIKVLASGYIVLVANGEELLPGTVEYPGILFRRGSPNSVEDTGQRERGSGGGSPLVKGSGGSCNLLQEISFHIVKFS